MHCIPFHLHQVPSRIQLISCTKKKYHQRSIEASENVDAHDALATVSGKEKNNLISLMGQ
jgi:hypothetical protein